MELFKPNDEQTKCIATVNNFIKEHIPSSKILINGSAGTGKTTIIISSVINILIEQVFNNIDLLTILQRESFDSIESFESLYKKHKLDKLPLNNFIISAPTNKAKDVLFTKYNIFIENELQYILENFKTKNESGNESVSRNSSKLQINNSILLKIIKHILNIKIIFLTVSQLLSIGRVINEMGIEEFTKGNSKKIIDKYNKSLYLNTSIIVDECSMIDNSTSKLLDIIKCPIIYIGDYCQLPPVNENISNIFLKYANDNNENDNNNDNDNENFNSNSNYITLKIVERCKNDITLIANKLRDKIYGIVLTFNLLTLPSPDLIIYNKKFSVWITSYINDIKKKQEEIYKTNTNMQMQVQSNSVKSKIYFDTMALGWTNNCCSYLNKKIRSLLFSEIKNIDKEYIIKGDKLLIKTPYYKYEYRLCSSNIVYVTKTMNKKYNPINFSDWCNAIIILNELETDKKQNPVASLEINIDNILETSYNKKPNKVSKKNSLNRSSIASSASSASSSASFNNSNTSNILNYFNTNTNKSKKENTNAIEINKHNETISNEELLMHRKLFYTKHIISDIITNDTYNFTDDISIKYNLAVSEFSLNEIKNLSCPFLRANAYTKWHNIVTTKLFGIPNDRICCKKCAFFIKKFEDKLKYNKDQSSYIEDFINVTNNLEFDIYLCDLMSFTTNGKSIYSNIPILDMSKQNNRESLETIRTIIKNSYEIKLMLSKIDEMELKSINKSIGEEGVNNDKTNKYITLSQLFGHYMSHIITSTYIEIDYGYALTIHKSQGSTYDDVYIEYSNILSNNKENENNKLLYTAITRCVNKLHVYY